jgi:hypothetical protein
MILGVCIFYDDGPALLERALTSLRKVTDKILAVDGAYEEFPHEDFKSGPQTLAIAKALADKVIIPAKPWKNEVEKRNSYLTLKSEKDYYIMLDADEEILGDKPKNLTQPTYRIKLETKDGDIWLPCFYNRLFRHHKGMAYRDHHNNLVTTEGLSLTKSIEVIPVYSGLSIKHYPGERPQARQERDGAFERNRLENKTPPPPNIKTPASDFKATPIQLKYISDRPYSGYDGVSQRETRSIVARQGDLIYVSKEKAAQLMKDFPKDWVKIKEL